ASAENAVLACVEADVLRPGVVNAVLQRVIDHYTMPAPTDDAKRASVSREIAKAEAEQQRLLKVVREGASDVTALAVALRAGQERIDLLKSQLEALTPRRSCCVDPA